MKSNRVLQHTRFPGRIPPTRETRVAISVFGGRSKCSEKPHIFSLIPAFTWLPPTMVEHRWELERFDFLQTSFRLYSQPSLPTTVLTFCILLTMIPPSAASFLLVLLGAALSVPPTLAAPQGRTHSPHSPWKDYSHDSGSSHKRLNLNDLETVGSCVLSAAELLGAGDKEFVFEDVHYSQVCLERLALTLDPEERAVCRTECPACVAVRGYNMPCIAERVLRSSQSDLTQLRDIGQPVSTTFEFRGLTPTYFPEGKPHGSDHRHRLRRSIPSKLARFLQQRLVPFHYRRIPDL